MRTPSDELFNYLSPYREKDLSKVEYYNNYKYASFEGHEFRIPVDYDKRLKQLYGDYMKLPPEDQRVGHVTEAYWVDKK